jgi:hypothetical protein
MDIAASRAISLPPGIPVKSPQVFLKLSARKVGYVGKEPTMASIAFASVGKLIELLNTATAGGDAFVRVLSINRLALGADPFHPSHIIDISREVLVPCSQDEPITLEMSMRHQGPSAVNG